MKSQIETKHADNTSIIRGSAQVCFDPEQVVLEGSYADELSAHRARRAWQDALEGHFLLEDDYDFEMLIDSGESGECFVLSCRFLSACARYAFWRLTNNQAPEAQYTIETAHIPDAESQHPLFLSAPDLRPVGDQPLIWAGPGHEIKVDTDWFSKVSTLIKKLIKT